MIRTITEYNGFSLNDSNYKARLRIADNPSLGQQVDVKSVPRGNYPPKISGKTQKENSIVVLIELSGYTDTLYDALLQALDESDETERVLKGKNEAGTEYYVMATLAQPPVRKSPSIVVATFYVADRIWRSVSASTTTWNVTASGQTKQKTIGGNRPAQPVITVKPRAAKGGGYAWQHWIPIWNPIDRVYARHPNNMVKTVLDTAAMVNDSTVSNRINQVGGIGAGDLSFTIDAPLGGGLAPGGGMLYVGTEQIYYTSIVANVVSVYDDGAGTTGRGWGGTTAATHADNAVCARSLCKADGSDIRVMIDGNFTNIWITGMNSANTKIFANIDLGSKFELQLDGEIAATGAVTTITVKKLRGSVDGLKRLAEMPNKVIIIDTDADMEAFTYTDTNPIKGEIIGTAREAKLTSAHLHADGAYIYGIDHDIWLVYGDPLATALDVDDAYKPMLDLVNTANDSWVWTEFLDSTAERPAAFAQDITLLGKWKASGFYTATEAADANPASVMGMAIRAYLKTIWRPDTEGRAWQIEHPAGYTHISTVTGKKYRHTASWPSIAGLQKYDGRNWVNVFTETSPSAAQTWEATASHSAVSLGGTYNVLRFILHGLVAGSADNVAYLEYYALTATVDSNNIPQMIFGERQSVYDLNLKFKNNTTGEYFTVRYNTGIDQVLTIDCDAETCQMEDGTIVPIEFDTLRDDWLTCPVGVNEFEYVDEGTSNADVTITTKDRSV